MSILRPSKLTLGTLLMLLWVLLPHNANAYDPVKYSSADFPWWSSITHPTPEDGLFRELQIQLCSIGIWQITYGEEVNPGSDVNPFSGGSIYSGISGAPRPSGTTIRDDHGSGYYYFESYNSSGCSGIDDEPFGVYSWAYFFVDANGIISNANIETPVYTPTVPISKNIDIINPTYGTTTATTTFAVEINYRTPFSIDFRPTTTRHFEIVDAVTGELNYSYNFTVPANSSENIQLSISASTTQGSKYIRAMYLDTLGNPYSEIDEVFFNVATNTYFIATGLLTPVDNPNNLTQIDCGTFEFGCQIQKAITFLFVPSSDVLDKFKNLWQTIAEKKPFGYVTVTINQLKALDVSGSSAFTLGTIPFMDSLFTPFRTAIATILWALFAIYFYQVRLKYLDI